jgi:acetylornithine deacetylase/succinyl-diaminopimelate desuccinylase-like protein
MPSYGLGGAWGAADDRRAHGNDERIGAREFDEGVEYTYRLMKAFGDRR